MTKTKAICAAAILSLALTSAAYAGDMHTPGVTGSPTTRSKGDTPGANSLPATTGDMGSPSFADTSLDDIMLDVLL
jgi:hypothetical protein